jgi:hypothetical protein
VTALCSFFNVVNSVARTKEPLSNHRLLGGLEFQTCTGSRTPLYCLRPYRDSLFTRGFGPRCSVEWRHRRQRDRSLTQSEEQKPKRYSRLREGELGPEALIRLRVRHLGNLDRSTLGYRGESDKRLKQILALASKLLNISAFRRFGGVGGHNGQVTGNLDTSGLWKSCRLRWRWGPARTEAGGGFTTLA